MWTLESADDGKRHDPVPQVGARPAAELVRTAENVVQVVGDLEQQSERFPDAVPTPSDRHVLGNQQRAELATDADDEAVFNCMMRIRSSERMVTSPRRIKSTNCPRLMRRAVTPIRSRARVGSSVTSARASSTRWRPLRVAARTPTMRCNAGKAAAHVAGVDDVVVEERSRMDELDRGSRSRDVGTRGQRRIAGTRREEKPGAEMLPAECERTTLVRERLAGERIAKKPGDSPYLVREGFGHRARTAMGSLRRWNRTTLTRSLVLLGR